MRYSGGGRDAPEMILRRERPDDHAAIRVVQTAAFLAPPGTLSAEARLVDELRADGDAIQALSLVAIHEDEVVGHVICSRANVGTQALLGLGPLAVLPSHQRRGVGHALMHAVLAAADALDEPGVAVLGDPGYYSRFGFVLAAPLGLLPPDPRWAQHFQVRPLTSWDGSARATFRYAAAFSRL